MPLAHSASPSAGSGQIVDLGVSGVQGEWAPPHDLVAAWFPPQKVNLDPQTTHKNGISPHIFWGSNPFLREF